MNHTFSIITRKDIKTLFLSPTVLHLLLRKGKNKEPLNLYINTQTKMTYDSDYHISTIFL